MKGQPLVSVIIPVYNVAEYLVETLESVVNQSYSNLEIILIDDGSTDGSGVICDKYAEQDSRIRLIHHPNQGVSVSRNAGLNIATGDLITFLDADDAYDSEHVEIMLDALNDSGADVVICKYSVHYTTGKMDRNEAEEFGPPIESGVYGRGDAMRALAANTIHAYLWNKLFRAALWKDIRFPVGMVYEDIDVIFRIINLCSTVLVLDQPLYLYRKRPGSITEKRTAESIRDWLSISFRVENFVKDNIPVLYTTDDLKIMRQARLRRMISYYVKYLPQKEKESKDLRKDLRNQIIRLKKKVGLGKCSFVMRISYWIILLCPWLLKILSPIYLAIKKRRNKH